jgi:glycosyltransferase involved in cell wall biosynthesis
MKILFLLTQDLESPAGIGRYFPLAKYLVRFGNRVIIVALHPDFTALQEDKFYKDGVEINYVGKMHVRKIDNIKSYYSTPHLILIALQSTFALTRAALRDYQDIVIIGKPHPMNSMAGLACRLFKKGTIFLDYDDFEAASAHFTSNWQKYVVAFFENNIPKFVHHITTHSSFLCNRLQDLGIPRSKITFLLNGIDPERFIRPDTQEVDNLRELHQLYRQQVVAFIGSMSFPSHPIELLLEAFRRILNQNSDVVLLLVGGGDLFNILKVRAREMQISSNIRFIGKVPAKDIPIYYRLADVTVDPVMDDSIAKGRTPIKMIESWICEVPFVTGDVGDRRELLGSPPAGLLANPGDPISLSECILEVLQNSSIAEELKIRGRIRVEQFTWEKLVGDLSLTFQQVIDFNLRH